MKKHYLNPRFIILERISLVLGFLFCYYEDDEIQPLILNFAKSVDVVKKSSRISKKKLLSLSSSFDTLTFGYMHEDIHLISNLFSLLLTL